MHMKLKGKRAERGLRQEDVANYIGISTRIYCLKENNKLQFHLSEINKLLKLFNCKYEDIF